MIKLNKVQKSLLISLLSFIQTSVYATSTERTRAWNELYSSYGERIVPTLKDVAHQAYLCRVVNAEAKRSGAPLDLESYDHHMIIAKSLAHAGAEDW